MYVKVDYPERECIVCGKAFKPKTKISKICSKPCRQKKWKLDNPERYKENKKKWIEKRKKEEGVSSNRAKRGPFICQGCDKEYYTRRPHGEGEKFCSRECAYSNQEKWNKIIDPEHRHDLKGEYCELPEYCQVNYDNCIECGDIFVKRYAAQYCQKHRGYQPIERECTCKICGTEYIATGVGSGRSAYCSDQCRQEQERIHRRIYKIKRRAQKQTNGPYENIDPFEIFERDSWICQGCGISTPKELRGTYEDNAPELDHIEPLSKGGTHTKDNTQCLCRQCNGLKSDKDMIEFKVDIWFDSLGIEQDIIETLAKTMA